MQRLYAFFLPSAVASALFLAAPLGRAQTPQLPPPAAGVVEFSRVEALFKERCQMCHGSQMQMSGLRLDHGEAALKGGYSGAAIVPGDSAGSKLINLVAGLNEKLVMPPAGERLTAEQIGILRAWIDQGAKWPASSNASAPPADERKKSDHWAFQPVRHPALPAVGNEAWVRNAVDRFVLARLEKEGVTPSPEASKTTLARRVSLDLVGLPPSPGDLEAFLADNSPQAYERLVDRLLDSPHFGERWAAQWLDLVRYGDSDGYEKDWERPHAWRYRQWVIDALNSDMAFDQFTIEQIAGDVLPGSTTGQKVATGFYRQTLKNREGGVNIEMFRFEETVDRANTIGAVWLGLTVGCAQCHDHKYDLISQKEYYQIFAFANNLDEVDIPAPRPGEMGPYLAALPGYRATRRELLAKNRVFELQPAWEKQMILAAENPGKWTDWDHAYDAFQKTLDGGDRIIRKALENRTEREQDLLTDHFVRNYHRVIAKDLWEQLNWTALRKELLALSDAFPDVTRAMTVEESPENRESHLHVRGGWNTKGIPVQPAVLTVLPPASFEGKHPRQALGEWLASRDNPLTARVMVNRIWQEYFGAGLVTTPDDFGKRSEPPSHPELLDWLSSEFMDHDWSLKHVHKTIVMSAAYRQSSDARPELMTRDPNNTLLARQRRLRLPAELIRDSALQASGLLYPIIGGRSVKPLQPEGVSNLAYSNSVKWVESTGRDRYRRGLYIHMQRTVPYPQLANFDVPERSVSECSRERSNTPLQALNLLNDPVFVEAAQALAVRVLEMPGDLGKRLGYAFELCLARQPSAAEVRNLREYYQRQVKIFEAEPESPRKFMPVELAQAGNIEAAAWTAVASVLLNLDEFITRE
ncbi:MAG: DUF1553 domain-containing protein [Bryobacterales bacterium]